MIKIMEANLFMEILLALARCPPTSAFLHTGSPEEKTLGSYGIADPPDGDKKGELRDSEITPQISETCFKRYGSGFAVDLIEWVFF